MSNWIDICERHQLAPDTGICALVDNRQIAVFLERKSNGLYAIGNYDPIGRANVLSRGLLGDKGGTLVVASPLYKQHFDLKTGRCLEDEEISVPVYQIREKDGKVQIAIVE